MSRRLVGDEVEGGSTAGELRHHVGGVRQQADGEWAALRGCGADPRDRVVERVGRLVQVARLEAAGQARRVDLDAEDRRAGHRRGERLRTAHAPEPGGQDRPARRDPDVP